MPPTEAEIASMLRRQGQKGDAGDPPKPPLRRRARGEPLWTELAADDPRWDLHCRPLLAFLEEPRPQRLVYVWVRQQGRPVGEAEAMLSWLESRGRIVRDRENRWVKAPFTVERSAVIVNEHGFVTEVPCAPEATP